MNTPHRKILNALDALIQRRSSFALYRLPRTETCHLVWQTSGEPERKEELRALDGERGFVIAPFHITPGHPLILIRPDVTAAGWKEIEEVVLRMQAMQPGYPSTANPPTDNHTPDTNDIDTPDVNPDTEKSTYIAAFERFIHPLREGKFQKLVLSRSASLPLDNDFSPLQAFVYACERYPRMMVYICHTPDSGTWMGSTPEVLLSGEETTWHTTALAGTQPMQGEEMPDTWSRKNREEQAYVAQYIHNVVRQFDDKLKIRGPYPARAGQLVHLKSDFDFRLKGTGNLGNLLQALHPTPAVCGLPKEETCRFITAQEGYGRSYYTGFIGWLDPTGYTSLYVNLRCMKLVSGKAILYAGGGILASSDAKEEWEETEEKMKTMREVVEKKNEAWKMESGKWKMKSEE